MKTAGKNAGASGDPLEPLLLPEEAAEILKLSASWLAKARMDGTGPGVRQIWTSRSVQTI